MRWLWSCGLLLALGSWSWAQPTGKLIRETWQSAYLNGQKAGYVHITVLETVQNGQTKLRYTEELNLNKGQISDEHGDEESPDGKLLGVFRKIPVMRGQINIHGETVDGSLRLIIDKPDGQQTRQLIALPSDLVTILSESSYLKQHEFKPGERLSYRQFDPEFNTVIPVDVEAKDYQVLPLNGVNRKLLRAVVQPPKNGPNNLPSRTVWYDEDFKPMRSQKQMQFGELTLVESTKQDALTASERPVNIQDQSIRLNRTVLSPAQLGTIVYRFAFTKDFDNLERAFKTGDNQQSVRIVDGNSLELTVTAVRKPPSELTTDVPDRQYLASNPMINCEDQQVRKFASIAVDNETNPWKKAQRIEKWVKDRMNLRVTDVPSPADRVAQTLTGDCKDAAVLVAAMCRAQQIPSRTAIGMIYTTSRDQPRLAYHMWTEVWVNGQWLGLDATRGYGFVGPDHVKVTDNSWKDAAGLTPMLPVNAIMMSKPTAEILRVER